MCLEPTTPMDNLLSSQKEERRKGLERSFGVLQAKFHIITTPSSLCYSEDIQDVMKSCIIMHNMIVS